MSLLNRLGALSTSSQVNISPAKTSYLNGRKVEQGKSDMPVLTIIGRLRKILGMEIRLKDKIIGLPTDLKLSSNPGLATPDILSSQPSNCTSGAINPDSKTLIWPNSTDKDKVTVWMPGKEFKHTHLLGLVDTLDIKLNGQKMVQVVESKPKQMSDEIIQIWNSRSKPGFVAIFIPGHEAIQLADNPEKLLDTLYQYKAENDKPYKNLMALNKYKAVNKEISWSELQSATLKTKYSSDEFTINRYRNILSAEKTQIKLEGLAFSKNNLTKNVGVNANKMDLRYPGLDSPFDVITMQAMTNQSKDHAFQMMVEQGVGLVIDLTNGTDRDAGKSITYIPSSKKNPYLSESKHIKVSLTKKYNKPDTNNGLTRNKFGIQFDIPDERSKKGAVDSQNSMSANVDYLQFENWPDHDAPTLEHFKGLVDKADSLITARTKDGSKPTVAIHCSAGVGRTGTLTVALALKSMAKSRELTKENMHGVINVLILQGREQRHEKFVQEKVQFDLLKNYASDLLKNEPKDFV